MNVTIVKVFLSSFIVTKKIIVCLVLSVFHHGDITVEKKEYIIATTSLEGGKRNQFWKIESRTICQIRWFDTQAVHFFILIKFEEKTYNKKQKKKDVEFSMTS